MSLSSSSNTSAVCKVPTLLKLTKSTQNSCIVLSLNASGSFITFNGQAPEHSVALHSLDRERSHLDAAN